MSNLSVQELARRYEDVILSRYQELKIVSAKYQKQFDEFQNNPVLKLFLNKTKSVVFEGWEGSEKDNLVAELNKYNVKHTLCTNGCVEW